MRRIILLMALWMMWMGGSQTAIAQEETPVPDDVIYDGVDVLLIVDQSGSMGGETFGLDRQFASPPTDPQNLRFVASQNAVRAFSRLRVFPAAQTLPDIHMAVLAFGDGVEPLMSWTALVPQNSQGVITPKDVWEQELVKFDDILSVQRFGFRNLGFTDFNIAFDAARDFYQAMPLTLAPQAGENRLRIVIIVTDGAACTRADIYNKVEEDPSYSCFDALNDGTAQRHMQRLAEQARTYFPAPGYELYAIMLDRDLVYANQVRPWWDDVVCQSTPCDTDLHNKIVTDESEMSSHINLIIRNSFQDIISDGIVTDIQIGCCPPAPFTVLPYQQVVYLDIFKNQPQPLPGLQIVNQSTGNQILTNPFGLDTLIETHEIRDPEPGQYLVTGSSYDIVTNVSFASISISANVPAVTVAPDPLTALNTMTVQAEVQGAAGLPINRYYDNAGNERYPLSVELRIYQVTGYPDANNRPLVATIPMQNDPNSADIHRYVAKYVLNDTFDGLYDMKMYATYVDDEGKTQILVNNRVVKSDLQIFGAYVDTWALEPNSQRAQREFKVRALVLTNQGQPVSNTSDMRLRVQAVALDGTVVMQPLVYPNQSAQMGIVEAGLILNNAGGYNIVSELGFTDVDGNFIPLGPSANLPIEIRAPQFVTLSITQPNPTDIVTQGFTLIPFEVINNPSTTIQVEIRDQNGGGINLSDLIGVDNALPSLRLLKDGETTDLTTQLTPVSAGIYSFTTDSIGTGHYQLEASVAEPLTGDYQWQPAPNATLAFTRDISPSFYTSILALVGLALLVLLMVGLLVRRIIKLSRHPLSGKIVIRVYRMDEGDSVEEAPTVIELTPPSRHTRRFTNQGKVKVLLVTTDENAENSKKGIALIKQLELNGVSQAEMTIPPMLSRGDVRDLAQVMDSNGVVKRYTIEKDLMSFSSSTFGSDANFGDFMDVRRDN